MNKIAILNMRPLKWPLRRNLFNFIKFLKKGFLLLPVAITSVAGADDSAPKVFKDSTDLDLDQLINIKVTSVSKKEENLNDAAAAIFVIRPP